MTDTPMTMIERLRNPRWEDHDGQALVLNLHGTVADMREAAATIERLEIENIQLKFACGYPMPADLEKHILPSNPFQCGVCAARNSST